MIDTNILVSGLRSSQGASARILQNIRSGRVVPCVSVPVFLEYEEVLKRPGLLPAEMTVEIVDAFLNAFLLMSRQVEVFFAWRPYLVDADDDIVLEASMAAGGVPIVTQNTSDFRPASNLGILVWSPADAVRNMNLS